MDRYPQMVNSHEGVSMYECIDLYDMTHTHREILTWNTCR